MGEAEENLTEDFAGIYYNETSTGKIRIEDKSITKRRLHRSPNAADAVVIGFSEQKSGYDWTWLKYM